ncbi:C6 transcription factor [Histoplasma capsulatum H143]|uniref:C6 transcription factor n=1 Tax=Ajellomyces capsulatus (strain H143) TaxID=544712 RepID=C6H3M5_AJECH|nr:C6 transcription factor [Histoplasma capsulatum H143]
MIDSVCLSCQDEVDDPALSTVPINKAARLSDLRSSTRSEGENVETASELTIPEGSNQSSSRSNSQLRRWMTDVPDRFDSVDFSNTSDVEEVLDGFPAIKPAKTVHSAHLLDIFYSRVFFSHPFILPRKYLVEEFERGDLGHLQAAIEYIASFHDPAMQTGHFRDAANSALLNRSLTPNVYMVQALLLFAIALHFGKESTLASSTLSQAIELAVELGMNNRQFNTGDVSSVYEESWRRTWWELYIFDGYLVSLRLRAHFTLHSIPSDVLLPCDDLEYVTGKIPPSRSLEEYQTKICPAFYDDRFSSYTCRIDSVRIFGKLQRPDQLYGLSLSSSPQLSPVSASNSSINQASVIVTQSDTTTPSNENPAPPRSKAHDDYHSQHSGTAQRSTNATERIAFQQPEPDESRFPQQDVHQSPTLRHVANKLPLDKTFGIVSSNAHSTLYLGGEIQKLFAIPKGCEFFGLNGEQMSPFFYLPSRSNPKHPPAPKWWNADFFIPGTRTLSPEILSRFEGPLATLLPTPAQLNYPHPYWIDTVPIPQLREAIIIALYHAPQLLDEMELIMDFCDAGGKFRGGGHFCDPKNWEIGDNFWLKWGFLVSPDMMRQTDRWRRMRGLPSITTSGRPGDLAITGIPGRRSKVFNYVPEEV